MTGNSGLCRLRKAHLGGKNLNTWQIFIWLTYGFVIIPLGEITGTTLLVTTIAMVQFNNHSGGQNHGGFRNNNGGGGAGNHGNQNRKPNPVDPKTGKQVCLAWNNTQCGYANCKFTHVCMICYEAHPRFKHENESASKNAGQH